MCLTGREWCKVLWRDPENTDTCGFTTWPTRIWEGVVFFFVCFHFSFFRVSFFFLLSKTSFESTVSNHTCWTLFKMHQEAGTWLLFSRHRLFRGFSKCHALWCNLIYCNNGAWLQRRVNVNQFADADNAYVSVRFFSFIHTRTHTHSDFIWPIFLLGSDVQHSMFAFVRRFPSFSHCCKITQRHSVTFGKRSPLSLPNFLLKHSIC